VPAAPESGPASGVPMAFRNERSARLLRASINSNRRLLALTRRALKDIDGIRDVRIKEIEAYRDKLLGENEERGAQVTDKVHGAGNIHLLLFAEASAHTLCGRRVIAYYPERCAGLTGSSAPIKCTTVPARVTCPQCASALNRPADIRITSENKANGRNKTHADT
jgi:hypothetical protein